MKKSIKILIAVCFLIVAFGTMSAFSSLQWNTGKALSLEFMDAKTAGINQVSDFTMLEAWEIDPINLESKYNARQLSILGEEGVLISATWFLSKNQTNNDTVILLHDAGNTKYSLYGMANSFLRNGFNVLAVDQRGFGGSDFPITTYGYLESRDLKYCIDEIKKSNEGKKIILYGLGTGAAAAAIYMGELAENSEETQVDMVILDSPYTSLTEYWNNERLLAGRNVLSSYEKLCINNYLESKYGFDLNQVNPQDAIEKSSIATLLMSGDSHVPCPPPTGQTSTLNKEYITKIYSFIGVPSHQIFFDKKIDRTSANPNIAKGQMSYSGGNLLFDDRGFNTFYFVPEYVDAYVNAMNYYDNLMGEHVKVHSLLAPMSCEFYLPEPYWSQYCASQEYSITYVNENLNARINKVDAYSYMKEHQDEYLYFNTDHHWTSLGAYYAYQAFMTSTGQEPWALSQYDKVESKVRYSGDSYKGTSGKLKNVTDSFWYYDMPEISYSYTIYSREGGVSTRSSVFSPTSMNNTKGQYYTFMGGDHPYCKIITENENEQKILVVKDSYGNAFVPFLIPHYKEIHVIDPRHCQENILNIINQNNITDVLFVDYTLVLGIPSFIQKIVNLSKL